MNAIGSPAAAGPPGVSPAPDRRDWLKLAGGMMFGAGVIVLLARKGQDWSDWAIFVVLFAGALILLGLGVARRAPGELGGWRTSFLVFGTLLLVASLLQFVNAAGGNSGKPLNLFWTFALAGAVAVVSSLALRANVQMLVGALFGLVVWVELWTKIIDNPSADTLRWLLVVLAAIYVVAAFLLGRLRAADRVATPYAPQASDRVAPPYAPQASDLITVAGIAAVLASIVTLSVGLQSIIGVGG